MNPGERQSVTMPGSNKDAENAGTGPSRGQVVSCHLRDRMASNHGVPGGPPPALTSFSRERALHVHLLYLSLSLSYLIRRDDILQMLDDLRGQATSPDQPSLFTGTHMPGSVYSQNDPHSFFARSQCPREFKKCSLNYKGMGVGAFL